MTGSRKRTCLRESAPSSRPESRSVSSRASAVSASPHDAARIDRAWSRPSSEVLSLRIVKASAASMRIRVRLWTPPPSPPRRRSASVSISSLRLAPSRSWAAVRTGMFLVSINSRRTHARALTVGVDSSMRASPSSRSAAGFCALLARYCRACVSVTGSTARTSQRRNHTSYIGNSSSRQLRM